MPDGILAKNRQRMVDGMDLAPTREERRVYVAQQFVRERQVRRDNGVQPFEIQVFKLHLAEQPQAVDLGCRDLMSPQHGRTREKVALKIIVAGTLRPFEQIGTASCRERV